MQEPNGSMILAEAYPHDEELITLKLCYAETPEDSKNHIFKFKSFYVQRGVAQSLCEMLTELLAAPDAETAWKQIANNPADAACCQAVEEYCAESEKG